MTQEILGYFLIRSLIMNNEKEDLIKVCSDKESFEYFIEESSKVIETEDFFLTSAELRERLETVLYHYRFEYNKDKKINDDMNKIITKLSEYKSLSPFEVERRYKNWVQEETETRGIPKWLTTPLVIYNLISDDATNMIAIINTEGEYAPESLLSYLSIINFMANKFPILFVENPIYDNILYNLNQIKEMKMNFVMKGMLKKTINNLKKLNIEIQEVTEEEIVLKKIKD